MIADTPRTWFASCARGLPGLLVAELEGLGAEAVTEQPGGAQFTGTRALMYRVCLWTRLANRVFLPLGEGPAHDADALYDTVTRLPWETVFRPGASMAVAFSGSNEELRNTRFGAQRSKDAIFDRLRSRGEETPRLRPGTPDLPVSVRLRDGVADIALDLTGESLHRRGYRRGSGEAPIKENLAAALLLRAGWPDLAREKGAGLIDPMCGSATLLIEGAMMALNRAPGLDRSRFAFEAWQEHVPEQWNAVRKEVQARQLDSASPDVPEIRGYDADPRVVRRAQENIAAAGLSQAVRVSVKALNEVSRPTHRSLPLGLLITNPPYGERLGTAAALPQLYRRLGELAHAEFQGWEAAFLAPNAELGKALGLRSHKSYAFMNGRIPVTLYLVSLINNRLADTPPLASRAAEGRADNGPELAAEAEGGGAESDSGAQMLIHRLRKNQRRLRAWLKKSGESCYRLYDADMPEYAVAIDRYRDWVHVAEYRAPAEIPAEVTDARLASVLAAVESVCEVDRACIVLKRRERQRGRAQYERLSRRGSLLEVREGEARLLVNLHDYLDTGLFLDHRRLRYRIGREAEGKHFLNLFCYTGSASVHAALGGARATVSVDLSNTYLAWLAKNLALNGLAETRHKQVRSDVTAFLAQGEEPFDLILLDPPSFSNSKRVEGSFDVQRDHRALVDQCMRRLAKGGIVYFSNNRRKFRLDPALGERYDVEDITEQTLDPDFPRRPPPHRCWQIRHREDAGALG